MPTRSIGTRFVKGHTNERGSVAVEFALVAPIFLMFVIGLVDYGRLFWAKSTIQYAVEQTARYAMVNPNATTAALVIYAGAQSNSILSGVTYTATSSVSAGVNYRTIQAQYTFVYQIPIIPLGDIVLAAQSSTPVNAP